MKQINYQDALLELQKLEREQLNFTNDLDAAVSDSDFTEDEMCSLLF
jgi:hypothetical protein